MVSTMCGVQFKDRRIEFLMLMLDLNEAMDQLDMQALCVGIVMC